MAITPEAVERVTQQMKIAFRQLKRQHDPKFNYIYGLPGKWTAMAEQLIAHQIDPTHYVRWIYNYYATIAPTVSFKHITSPKALAIYMKSASYKPADRLKQLKLKVQIQFEVVRQQLSLGVPLRVILCDDSLTVGPLVRYVLAHHGGLTDLANDLRAEAEISVRLEPLYKEILGDKLPPIGG